MTCPQVTNLCKFVPEYLPSLSKEIMGSKKDSAKTLICYNKYLLVVRRQISHHLFCHKCHKNMTQIWFRFFSDLVNEIHSLYPAYQYKLRSREYWNILDLGWHLSGCTYRDVKFLMETAARIARVMQDVSCSWVTSPAPPVCVTIIAFVWIPGIVHRTTLSPIYISQTQSTLYNANLFLFTSTTKSNQSSELCCGIYQSDDEKIKNYLYWWCFCLSQIWLNLEIM